MTSLPSADRTRKRPPVLARLARDTRGAVLAEFAIAIVPLLLVYFCFLQVAYLFTADLVFQHAGVVAARAASVIAPPNPGNNGSMADITEAAKMALGPWLPKFGDVTAQSSAAGDQHGMVTTTVTGTYQCTIPLGGPIVCPGGSKVLTAVVAMPLQGARYQ